MTVRPAASYLIIAREMEKKKCVALYCRVSTEDQKLHGISIDSQIDALQKYAAEHGYTVVDIYNDAGHSAHTSYKRRGELLRMLADISARKIDLVLFCRLDRWFRNLADYYKCQEILDANGVTWKAIWEDYDTETAEGRFKVNIMLSFAEHEASADSERIKAVKKYKREKGEIDGKPPIGYIVKDKHLVKDPASEEWVNAFFRAYFSTKSKARAADAAIAHGGKVSREQMYRFFQKGCYYGHPNEFSTCEPYITEEEHQYIVSHMGTRTRYTGKHDYLFSGLVVCSCCGRSLRGSYCQAPGRKAYYHYRCDRFNLVGHKDYKVSEIRLEDYLLTNIEQIIAEHNEMVSRAKLEPRKDNTKELKKLEGKLNRIKVLFEDGDIDVDAYRQKRDVVKAQITALEDEAASTEKMVVLDTDWKTAYDMLDSAHRRQVWQSVIKKIVVDPDKNVVDIVFC